MTMAVAKRTDLPFYKMQQTIHFVLTIQTFACLFKRSAVLIPSSKFSYSPRSVFHHEVPGVNSLVNYITGALRCTLCGI